MKKTVIFVVLALAMVLIGSCAAQSANDAQRIVGTWVSADGQTTLVFNADGTGTVGGNNFFYGISVDGVLQATANIFGSSNYGTLFFSPDGKRIIIRDKVYQRK